MTEAPTDGRIEPVADPAGGPVQVSIEAAVATLSLNRPPMNAIDTPLRQALVAATRKLADEPDVRACVLYGGPAHFAAGADIKQLSLMSYTDIVAWNAELQHAFTAIAALPFPVIAAVNGFALGGGLELALAADVRIGASDCTVGLPEVTLGIIPGSGGTQRLTQIVGRSTAKMLIMTGRRVPAEEAAHLGLLDELVAPDRTYATAHALASRLAAAPPFAVRAIKECVDAALPISPAALALERSLLAGMFATDERTAAMADFLTRQEERARQRAQVES
jgi:enoyl-CoA hydratase/carnithine racemase